MPCEKPLIFISYSHDPDAPVAFLIDEILQNMEYKVYLDQRGLLNMPDDWRNEVKNKIQEADRVIFICSPQSLDTLPEKILQNDGMGFEYRCALDNNKTIVPVSTVSIEKISAKLPEGLKYRKILAISWDSFIGFKENLREACKVTITLRDVINELEKMINAFEGSNNYYHLYQLYNELVHLSMQNWAEQEYILKNANFRKRKRECFNKLNFLEKMKIFFIKSQKEKEIGHYTHKWNILHNHRMMEKWYVIE